MTAPTLSLFDATLRRAVAPAYVVVYSATGRVHNEFTSEPAARLVASVLRDEGHSVDLMKRAPDGALTTEL
jgi:hypothetical protein